LLGLSDIDDELIGSDFVWLGAVLPVRKSGTLGRLLRRWMARLIRHPLPYRVTEEGRFFHNTRFKPRQTYLADTTVMDLVIIVCDSVRSCGGFPRGTGQSV